MSRTCIIGLLLLALLSGCSANRVIKPRSELIKEAQDAGVPISSIDQDRQAFFEHEEEQRRRLISLISNRAQNSFQDSTYRVGAHDEIEVNVFDVPELNLKAVVNQSGFLSLPLIGAVKAAGLTVDELREGVKSRLSTYVRDPQVSIGLSGYGSQIVAVTGAVRKPGMIPLRKGSNSVLELISEAGGVSDGAGNYINFIPAELSGISARNDVEARARLALATVDKPDLKEAGIEIYLDQVLGTTGGIPLEIPVRGGDMLILPEAGKVMVHGEVQKGGSYPIGQQTTLLGVLALASGITYGAKIDEVEVIRQLSPTKRAHLIVDLTKIATGEETDVRIRGGDIVQVPSESGRRMAQDTFEGITKIINFGIGGTVSLVP